jgi:NTP pyrophosphatase (non-canonical NTP hydrolase)
MERKVMRDRIYSQIEAERIRQDGLWGEQRHTLDRWLTILVEEVGEVAKAMQGDDPDRVEDEAEEELIQVAAVAVQIVEKIQEARERRAISGNE